MTAVCMVGLGGAVGAMGRFALSLIPTKTAFPILTLLTNFLGAILIGVIIGLTVRKELPNQWVLFWKTGVCGGFTTFSTFSLETLQLFESGKYLSAGIYVFLSVMLCLFGVALGRWMVLHFLQG